MARCSFCEKIIPAGTGKMYVKTEGKILYFCSHKCEMNKISLERKAARLKWTRASRKLRSTAAKAKKGGQTST